MAVALDSDLINQWIRSEMGSNGEMKRQTSDR